MAGMYLETCEHNQDFLKLIANDWVSQIGGDIIMIPKNSIGTISNYFAAGFINITLQNTPTPCKATGVESVQPVPVFERVNGVNVFTNLQLIEEIMKLMVRTS